ncbi:MAG: hypothetical protein LBU04_02890 [Christensenellaceae bacterium]|nr:hypothetical protein [Christensenellaceae bacterium]
MIFCEFVNFGIFKTDIAELSAMDYIFAHFVASSKALFNNFTTGIYQMWLMHLAIIIAPDIKEG